MSLPSPFRTYLGANSRMYRSNEIPSLIRLSSGCTEHSNITCRLGQSVLDLVNSALALDTVGSSFSVVELLDTWIQCLLVALLEMGNENSMLTSGLALLRNVVIHLPPHELLQMLSLDCVSLFFQLMTGNDVEGVYGVVASRLCLENMSKLWEAAGLLASRVAICASAVAGTHISGLNDFDHFMFQALTLSMDEVVSIFSGVCDHLCTELASITTESRNDSSGFFLVIACLRGAARWVLNVSEDDWRDGDLLQIDTYRNDPDGIQQQHMINQLLLERRERIKETSQNHQNRLYIGIFNSALPFLMSGISTLTIHESETQLELLNDTFRLIIDYVEFQFANLPRKCVMTLFDMTLQAMVTFSQKQSAERNGTRKSFGGHCFFIEGFAALTYVHLFLILQRPKKG